MNENYNRIQYSPTKFFFLSLHCVRVRGSEGGRVRPKILELSERSKNFVGVQSTRKL